MICKTAYYNSGAGTYQALTQETKFLSYTIQHGFNNAAECIVTLSDPTGAIMQKYDVATNEVYVGAGKIMIQDPSPSPDDDTTNIVFYGRIIKAQHNTQTNRVTLYCQDWLSQLADERIHYDFREDLDGSGLRQSELKPDPDSILYVGPTWKDGTDYFIFDNDMSWATGQFKGYKMVLTAGHAGSIKVNTGAYSASITDEAGGSASETGVVANTWIGNGTTYSTAQDADKYWDWDFLFRTDGTDGSLYSSITGARVIIEGSLENSGVSIITGKETVDVQIYVTGGLGNPTIGYIPEQTGTVSLQKYTFEVPEKYLSELVTLLNNAHYAKVTLVVYGTSDGAGTEFVIDSIRYELDLETTGTSSVISITDMFKSTAAIDTAYRYEDGVGYTDETIDMNDAGVSDVQLLPNPISQNDAFYFGFAGTTNGMLLTISQAGDYTGTLAWQYWNGSSWASLSSVVDDTNGFENAGTNTVTWPIPSDWATVAVNGTTKYWVRANMITALPAIAVTPLATQGWGFTGTGNRLQVGTDVSVSGLGLWEGCPYSIVQPIYSHLNAMITDTTYGCPLVALTSSLESTTGYTTRHYIDRTRLEILKDVCRMDKAVFWVALNDPTPTVNYKSTFNNGAPTAITDASVLSWAGGEYDFMPMFNEYHVTGIRIGDSQIYVTSEDLGTDPGDDSQLAYGVHKTGIESTSGTMSEYEAEQLAGALVERDEDVNLFLNATLGGLSSLRLGDELSITSTMLGLTAEKYVITHWSYDSKSYRTTARLHPRTASTKGFVDRVVFGEHIRRIVDNNKQQTIDSSHADLTTQEWG